MAVILVVDDRPINREFLVALLEYAGHEIHTAGDGLEGLEIARQVEPALVITDVLMPTMDGVEFTRQLHADPKLRDVPVIFYTATYRLPEAHSLAASCGVATVLAKPSEPQEVLDAVHAELGVSTDLAPPDAMPTWTGRYRVLAMDRLCTTTVQELSSIQQQLRSVIEQDVTPSTKTRQLKQITTHLDVSLRRAQALSMRLAALVELGLDLSGQADLRPMLEMFCHASQDIISTRYVAVCAIDEDGATLELVTRGMTLREARQVEADLRPTSGWFADVMLGDSALRFNGVEAKKAYLSLPPGHPPVANIIAMPLKSADRTYGWFYACDKLGGEFAEEDEQLVQTLVAQFVPAYENLVLMDRLRRHAGILEIEVDERKQALAELRESETRFRQLAENIREVFFLVDARSGGVLYVSPAYEDTWGKSRESLYENPSSWLESVHREDYRAVIRRLVMARRSGDVHLKCRIRHSDGSTRWVKAKTFPIQDGDGELDRIAGVAEDITETEVQEQRIGRLLRIQAVLSGINSAIVRIHERSALLDEAARIAVEHGGFAVAWIGLVQPGSTHIEFVAYSGADPRVADAFSGGLVDESIGKTGLGTEALRSGGHVVNNDMSAPSRASRVRDLALENGYASAVALPLMPDDKSAGVIVLFAREREFFDAEELKLLDELAGDVSFALEYIAREEQLRYLAYYDSLTDLPNTTLFHEHLAKSIERGPDSKTALFLIDLDRFTHLNDTLGRHVGDELLTSFGKRLKSLFTAQGNVARIGSDTFAVAVSALRDEALAGAILQERILAAFGRPFEIDGRELRVSARVGVAVCPADGQDPDTLFKNAEAALKEAKSSGARYLFYSSRLNDRIAEDLALEQQLLVAVEKRQFEVHYQPKIEVASGEIVGFEALLRWNSPERGLVAPAVFIPALEASELILDVGRWVLEKTLADRQAWQGKGLAPPPVAVNVSPLQLRYDDFAEMVLTTVDRYDASDNALELEITESVIMADIESSIERLASLSTSGVTIAIDDFGTGYSSLRYLSKLPLNALKIDRSFIVAMTSDADSMTLVSTIIALAHSFGLKVVAEGVDSEEQAKLLRLMKCDLMQGYLFGRPQPAAAVERLLSKRAH